MASTQVSPQCLFPFNSCDVLTTSVAFAKGKVPSNKQIDVAMNTALAWKGMSQPNTKLSADGQKLVSDLRNVIEKAKVLMLTKNEGNLLQDFIWQTQAIGAGDAKAPGAPIDKATAEQHGQQALEGLRTLGQLIITNGQFRKLCMCLTTSEDWCFTDKSQ